MSYPNLKMTALVAIPWICGFAACRIVSPYTPSAMWPGVCLGTAVGLTSMAALISARLTRQNLGGSTANPQPDLTAGANAHESLHPLESAPLQQRRPWALPSLRTIAVLFVAVLCALAMQWHWLQRVPLFPVNRVIWHIVCAIIYASNFSLVALIGGGVVIYLDLRAEQRGGAEADSQPVTLDNP